MSNTELKKCPFCGGNADIKNIQKKSLLRGVFNTFYVKCKVCSASAPMKMLREDAAEAWNRRAE